MAPKKSKKVSERSIFAVDELVFAQMKGFPPWPARITAMNAANTIYDVHFFAENLT